MVDLVEGGVAAGELTDAKTGATAFTTILKKRGMKDGQAWTGKTPRSLKRNKRVERALQEQALRQLQALKKRDAGGDVTI